MMIINICMFIFFVFGSVAGSANTPETLDQKFQEAVNLGNLASSVALQSFNNEKSVTVDLYEKFAAKIANTLRNIQKQNPDLHEKCVTFYQKDFFDVYLFIIASLDLTGKATNTALTQEDVAKFVDWYIQAYSEIPEEQLEPLLRTILDNISVKKRKLHVQNRQNVYSRFCDDATKMSVARVKQLQIQEHFFQEEAKKRDLIKTIAQKLCLAYCTEHGLNLVSFEEEQERINLEDQIFKVLSDGLSDQNFKAFCEHVRLKNSYTQDRQELFEQEEQEQFAIKEEFEKVKLEEKYRLSVENLKKINASYDKKLSELSLQFQDFLKNTAVAQLVQKFVRSKISGNTKVAQETKIMGCLQQNLNNKNLKAIKDARESNALHSKAVAAKKAARDAANRALEDDQRKKLQKLFEESQLMFFEFEKKMNQFDQKFDQWQKAIVLIQQLLFQKTVQQQKQECEKSFNVWKSAVQKHLNEHKTSLSGIVNDHEHEILKIMAENREQKSNKILTKSLFARWFNFVSEQKNQRLLPQAELEQVRQVRQHNPYGDPFDNQEQGADLNVPELKEKYFYWKGFDGHWYAQDDQGFKYTFNGLRWELIPQIQNDHQTLEESLQQAQANGWPISTIEELQKIQDLNEKSLKANQAKAERNARIAQGLQRPPRRFLN